MNSPQSVDPKKEFDRILCSFESELVDTKLISDGLYERSKLLSDFILECDSEKSIDKSSIPDGIITAFERIISRIVYLNRRNTEILNHLNRLI